VSLSVLVSVVLLWQSIAVVVAVAVDVAVAVAVAGNACIHQRWKNLQAQLL